MSDPKEIQAAIDKIQKLLRRTEANGAAENEVDSAAKQIGRLVMKFPQLIHGIAEPMVTIARSTARSNWQPSGKRGPSVSITHRGIVCESLSAILFAFGPRDLWVSKKHIFSITETTVEIRESFAKELGLT